MKNGTMGGCYRPIIDEQQDGLETASSTVRYSTAPVPYCTVRSDSRIQMLVLAKLQQRFLLHIRVRASITKLQELRTRHCIDITTW